MNLQEWKDEFAKRCDASIEAVKHMHAHMEDIEKIEGDVDEDEVLTFIAVKTMKMQKVLESLG